MVGTQPYAPIEHGSAAHVFVREIVPYSSGIDSIPVVVVVGDAGAAGAAVVVVLIARAARVEDRMAPWVRGAIVVGNAVPSAAEAVADPVLGGLAWHSPPYFHN